MTGILNDFLDYEDQCLNYPRPPSRHLLKNLRVIPAKARIFALPVGVRTDRK
jgi:hypothetical protein